MNGQNNTGSHGEFHRIHNWESRGICPASYRFQFTTEYFGIVVYGNRRLLPCINLLINLRFIDTCNLTDIYLIAYVFHIYRSVVNRSIIVVLPRS